MDWSRLDFDWNQVRAFLATAEEGSLSAAARALGATQPTLGRQVSALEAALGVTLFERVGRGLVLTPAGRDLLEHVRAMGEAAMRVSLLAAGRREDLAGRVTLSLSDSIAIHVMPDILVDLSERVPEVEIEVLVSNTISDLLRREADIALRHVRPEEPELVAKLIRTTRGHLYAAPSFLRRYGRPARLEDLPGLPFVAPAPPEQLRPHFERLGLPIRPEDIKLFSDSAILASELVRRGVGFGIMTEDVASRMPELERIVPDFTPIPVPLWLTTHRDLRNAARIRVVFDHLAEALARGPRG